MDYWLQWVLQWLMQWGIAGILIGSLIEALGIPFPGGLLLIFAGFFVGRGEWPFFLPLLAAVAGFQTGALMAYILGRRGRLPGSFRWRKAVQLFHQSAAGIVILGRFIPFFSNTIPYLAGYSRVPLLKFIGYNTLFALGWATFNLSLGAIFGYYWYDKQKYVKIYLPLTAAVILLVYLVIKSRRQKV